MLDRVVRTLKECGVPRLTVTRVHAIGAGVDPASQKFSLHEASAYADKAQVLFICDCERCDMFVELIANSARTNRRGDGIIAVYPVTNVTKIRTGVDGLAALK
jgi:nitrogen regulatory protein PII